MKPGQFAASAKRTTLRQGLGRHKLRLRVGNHLRLSLISFSFAFTLSVLFSPSAFAACTSPAGNAGDVFYSNPLNLLAYCNGSNWVAMGSSSTTTFGTLTSPDFCTATSSTAITCTTASTGSGNVVLSSGPTLTGTVAGVSSTWTTNVAIGTSTLSGALNVAGTATATTFSGSGASLTNIGTTNMTAVTGTANSTTFLRGDNSWATPAASLPSLTNTDIWVGNGSNVATAVALSGDCAIANTGAITCTKTSGVAFGTLATLSAAPAGTLTGTTLASNVVTSSLTSVGTIGTGTWQGTTIGVTYGGTGVSNPTLGAIYKGNGSSAMATSALSDNGTIVSTSESVDLTSNAAVTEIANEGVTGTTVNKLAKLTGAPSTVKITATPDTSGAVGIVMGGAGTSSNAQIAVSGQANCVFENATVAGDYVQIGSSTAGDCHDAGSAYPNTGQVLGRVLTTNSSTTTPRAVALFGPEIDAAGVPAGTTGQVQYNSGSSSFAANSNFTWLASNTELVVGTGAATPVGTTGTVAGVVMNVIPQAATFTTAAGSGGLTFNTAATGQMAYYSGAAAISGTSNLYVSGSNIAIGTSSATNLLSLGGQAAQTFWMEREYTSNTAGNNLTLQAGGATSAATNKNGGNLVLASGISTGTGTSNIQFNTFPGTAGSTTDNTVATAMTITGAGNVGIGTTSPNAALEVSGQRIRVTNGTDPGIEFNNGSAVKGYLFYSTGGSDYVGLRHASANPQLVLSSNGNVGIGTTNPLSALEVEGQIQIDNTAYGRVMYSQSGTNIWSEGPRNTTDFHIFRESGSGNVIIDSGNVGVGVTPSYPLHVSANNATSSIYGANSSVGQGVTGYSASGTGISGTTAVGNASAYGGYFTSGSYAGGVARADGYAFVGTGIVWATGAGSFNQSDGRLKENIITLTGNLDKIAKLRPVSYTWKPDSMAYLSTGKARQLGLIAQEAKLIVPEAVILNPLPPVTTRSDGEKYLDATIEGGSYGVDYTKFVPILIGAVQEIKALFDGDHDALAKLKADNDNEAKEIKELRSEIEQLKVARH